VTGWDDLVSTALLGTERHRVDVAGLPGPVATLASGLSDADARLLGAAALATSYRRAGVRALPGVDLPAAAEAESAPVVGPWAAGRLGRILGREDAELLREWLVAVAAGGLRPPAEALPPLLDTAARQPAIAQVLAGVLGERGRWLAGFRKEWRRFAAAAETAADPSVWTYGDGAARRAYLAALRGRDPAAARDLLTAGWEQESAADRAQFLALLGPGLSRSDEALLEAALDDRSVRVRQAAANLLAQLPGSAYAGRMVDRLRGWVRLERRMLRSRLVVTPPVGYDASMRRDMIPPDRKVHGHGPRAGWLREVIEAAPLSCWRDLLGIDDPAAVVALPVDNDWAPVLLTGWAYAAMRQRDADWAAVLLGRSGVDSSALLGALPPERRAVAVVREVRERPTTAHAMLALCPGPWPVQLADAVLGLLRVIPAEPGRAGSDTDLLWRYRPVVLRLAAHRLPPGTLPRVQELAPLYQPGTAWAAEFAEAVDLLMFRRQMLEEIS
jgi:Family of unknown function (DUF5691)